MAAQVAQPELMDPESFGGIQSSQSELAAMLMTKKMPAVTPRLNTMSHRILFFFVPHPQLQLGILRVGRQTAVANGHKWRE